MFLILVLSSLSPGTDYVFAESVSENFQSIPIPKMFTIDLTEEIGIKEPKKQSEKSKLYAVSLQERIGLTNNSVIDELVLIKYESDRKAILERVVDRQLKFKQSELKLSQIILPSIYLEQDIADDSIYEHFDLSFDKLNVGINDLIPNIFESRIISNLVNVDPNISQINVEFLNDQLFDPKIPILLILLIPFSGFVLIRHETEQIKFHHIKQFFTFIFLAILVSSAVITPMSISSSYWGPYAFAEIDNSTETISQPENILQNNSTTILQNNQPMFGSFICCFRFVHNQPG